MQNAEPEEVYDAVMGGEMLLSEFMAWLAFRQAEAVKSKPAMPRKTKGGDAPSVLGLDLRSQTSAAGFVKLNEHGDNR